MNTSYTLIILLLPIAIPLLILRVCSPGSEPDI